MSRNTFHVDDRAVSVAVTHVLAIGITTLLISGLVVAAAGLLTDQRQQAAQDELRTIGERIATQIVVADRMASPGAQSTAANVTFTLEQPPSVAGRGYGVELIGSTSCQTDVSAPGALPSDTSTLDYCILLTHSDLDRPIVVPVGLEGNPDDLDFRMVGNGEFEIEVSRS